MGHAQSVASVAAMRDAILLRLHQRLSRSNNADASLSAQSLAVFESVDIDKRGWIPSSRLAGVLEKLGLDRHRWSELAVDQFAHSFAIDEDPERGEYAATTSSRLNYRSFLDFVFFPMCVSGHSDALSLTQKTLTTLSTHALVIHTGEFSGEKVTVKELAMSPQQSAVDQLRHQINCLQLLSQPNIVRYRGTLQCKRSLFIIEEAHPSCTLKTVLESFGAMKESTVRRYAAQMFTALAFLHDHDVIHGNLHTEAINIDSFGTIKLSEFGIAQSLQLAAQVPNHANEADWTVIYPPPEWQDGNRRITKATDTWNAGVLLLQMLNGYSTATTTTKDKIQSPSLPASGSKALRQVVQACLQRQPRKRATAAEILAMEFCQLNAQATNDVLRDVVSDLDASMRRLTALGTADYKATTDSRGPKHVGRQTVPAIKTPIKASNSMRSKV